MSTDDDQFDVARWLTIARRVQVQIQPNGHLRQRNASDRRLAAEARHGPRREVAIVHTASWILETESVLFDVRLRSERERLDVDADSQNDQNSAIGIMVGGTGVALF